MVIQMAILIVTLMVILIIILLSLSGTELGVEYVSGYHPCEVRFDCGREDTSGQKIVSAQSKDLNCDFFFFNFGNLSL